MDVSKRYSIKLNKISNRLADLQSGHIDELTRTPCPLLYYPGSASEGGYCFSAQSDPE